MHHHAKKVRWPSGVALFVLVALALLVGGCRGSKGTGPTADPSQSKESTVQLVKIGGQVGLQMDPDSVKLAGITTAPAQVDALGRSVEPAGEVSATDGGTIQVTSRLPGRIVQVAVSVGQRVHPGQLLASVDSVDLAQAEAGYETALAHLHLMDNQLQQQKKLAKYGTLSEPAIEDARRTLAAAEAAVKSDEDQLAVDNLTLKNTQKLVSLGEITRKPVDDAQNAYAQTQAAAIQARVTQHSAKANLDRAQILYKSGVFSRQQLEDAETADASAVAAVQQTETQEKLAADELARQKSIFQQNLNGAASLQAAQSKVQQDQHTYENDLTAVALARTAFRRAQAVHSSGIPVSQALQQAQDAFDEAKVALQGAANTVRLYGVQPGSVSGQLNRSHAVIPIVSPLDAIVASRNMAVGQMTDTSTPLVKLLNLDRVYVNGQVYEKDLTDVAVGDPVRIRVAAFPSKEFDGTVSFVGHEVSEDTRTITVRTDVKNPGWLLRPGMFATIKIGSRSGSRALAIPDQAVLQDGAGLAVYVQVAEHMFAKRTVKVGTSTHGVVPVLSGLSPGDRVVTSGGIFLQSEQQRLENEKRGGG